MQLNISKITKLRVALLLALVPAASYGLGLGKIQINSAIGEPFKAEIEILGATEDELATLNARIAKPEEYEAAGLQDVVIPRSIKITPQKNKDGNQVLKLYSADTINEPFLEILIQLDSSTSHLQRQYTAILDLPTTTSNVDGDTFEKPLPAKPALPQSGAVDPDAKPTHKPRQHIIPPKDPAPEVSEDTSNKAPTDTSTDNLNTKETYTTQPGDIIGKVAQRYQPPGVSLKKVVSAFYKANPDAFLNGNLHDLKVGQVLHIPNLSIKGTELKDDTKKVDANPNPKTPPALASGEKVKDPNFVLKLSSGAADEQITLGQNPKASATAPIQNAEVPAAVSNNPAAPSKPAESSSTTTEQMQRESTDKPAVAPISPPSNPTPPVAAKIEVKPAPIAIASADDPEAITLKISYNFLWILGGISLTALLIVLIVLRNKMRSNQAAYAYSNIALDTEGQSGEPPRYPEHLFQNIPEDVPDVTSSATASRLDEDHDQEAEVGSIYAKTTKMNVHDEVDPLAEAEVYLAYGRDKQAEDILNQGLDLHPDRQDIALALLKIYAERKDKIAFEQLTIKMELADEKMDDATWEEVRSLGQTIDPKNKQYWAKGEMLEDDHQSSQPLTEKSPSSTVDPELMLDLSLLTESSLQPETTKKEESLEFEGLNLPPLDFNLDENSKSQK